MKGWALLGIAAAVLIGALLPLQALVNARLGALTQGALYASFVSFLDGNNFLGTVAVVNGVARFTTSALGAGSHSIRVVYSDAVDLRWNGSRSAGVTFRAA